MRRTRGLKKAGVYAESSEDENEPKKKSPCFESSDSIDAFETSESKKASSLNDSKKRISSVSSDDAESKSPDRKKVARIQPSDSSSSESDIETYLKRPDELNLNSTFFKIDQPRDSFAQIEKNIFEDVKQLSESESDVELEEEKVEVKSKTTVAEGESVNEPPKATFEQLTAFAKKIEKAKLHVEKYEAMKKKEEKKVDINKLLTMGEKTAWDSPEMLKGVNSALAEKSLHSSEFESFSESEKEDWEEVEQTDKPPKPDIIPKGGVEITVRMPDTMRKKKGVDLLAAMKRRLNRIKKENQLYVHRVHLLSWIAHGNYVNDVLNKETVLALALSLLPSQQCYPSDRTDLKYLEQILTWYRKTVTRVDKTTPKNIPLDKNLIMQINKKQAQNSKMYVYIFICILRALGIQCRLVLSLQVEPLRPPAGNLHSLAKSGENNASTSGVQNGKETAKTTNKKSTEGKRKTGKKNVTPEKEIIHEQKSERKRKSVGEQETIATKKSKAKTSGKSSAKIDKNTKGERDTDKLKDSDNKRTRKKGIVEVSKERGSEDQDEEIKSKSGDGVEKLDIEEIRKIIGAPSKAVTINPKGDGDTKRTGKQTHKKVVKNSDSANGDSADKQCKDVPKRATRSRKSASKIEKTLDDYIATLEDLEKVDVERDKPGDTAGSSKTNSNPTSETKLQIPTMLDGLDRDHWRRSKSHSPYGSKCDTETAPTLEKSISSCALDETADEIENKIEVKKGRGKKKNPGPFRIPLKRKVKSSEIPQVDGIFYSSDESSDHSIYEIAQLDGNDDEPSTSKKPSLHKLKEQKPTAKKQSSRLKIQPIYNEVDSEDDFRPRNPNHDSPKINLSKLKDEIITKKSLPTVNLQRLSQTATPKKPLDIRGDIVGLIKGRIREQKHKDKAKLAKKTVDDDSDSDYAPMPVIRKNQSPDNKLVKKVPVKRRVKPRSELDRKVFSSDEEGGADAAKKKKGLDIWIEVYLENEEKWISADVVKGQVHCVKEIYLRASHPVSYILAWDNTNRVKDITKRYCSNWNTVTRKLRTDQKWWERSLAPFVGKKNARDKEEDEDLARQQLDQPLPKAISEFKDHPLYVLQRHLLKFQAIYPPDAITLGFVRNEPVYSRSCVFTLHSREIWLKHAKVVKPGEKPYKIVKARPKYDRSSNTFIKDQLLEIFGEWQIQDYEPPTAENGVVPRNAYGNVELFKECMLPKGTVHLQLPGLNKVAKKLNVDCAPAVTGFDFHSGWSHPTFDGFIVCEEFVDTLVAAWYQEQEDMEKREKEKYEKRVYGNWKRLIKGLFIRERLKARYDFGGELTVPIPKPPEKPETKPKGPRFIINKNNKKKK